MKVLFLTGPCEVAQSHFINELSLKFNFFKFDMQECIKKYATKRTKISFFSLYKNKERSYLIYENLLKEFNKQYNGKENVIITGIKKIEEIEYIVSYYVPELYEVLYLDANLNLLKSNYECEDKLKIKNDIFLKQLDEKEGGLTYLKHLSINNVYNFRYYKKNTNEENIQIHIFENNSKIKKLTFEKK